jgi:hypothetical protein
MESVKVPDQWKNGWRKCGVMKYNSAIKDKIMSLTRK